MQLQEAYMSNTKPASGAIRHSPCFTVVPHTLLFQNTQAFVCWPWIFDFAETARSSTVCSLWFYYSQRASRHTNFILLRLNVQITLDYSSYAHLNFLSSPFLMWLFPWSVCLLVHDGNLFYLYQSTSAWCHPPALNCDERSKQSRCSEDWFVFTPALCFDQCPWNKSYLLCMSLSPFGAEQWLH